MVKSRLTRFLNHNDNRPAAHIIHEELGFCKLSAQWKPRLLAEDHDTASTHATKLCYVQAGTHMQITCEPNGLLTVRPRLAIN